MIADTIDARRTRIRYHAATDADMAWLRITRRPSNAPSLGPYVCDCRCRCHASSGPALSATGAEVGSCGLAIDLASLDCARGCRAAHILASECVIDETRAVVGAHV